MERPGISRAVPMGVLGFMVGALLVILVRALQSLPIWDAGTGIIFGTLFCAGFFVWGIGGFDPRMSVHGEHTHDDHAPAATESKPLALLSSSIWQLTFWLLILMVVLAAGALLGPALTITDDPTASALMPGALPMTIGTTEIQVSKLAIFAGFVIFTIASLALFGGGIAWAMSGLSRGIIESRPGRAAPETTSAPREEPKGLVAIAIFLVKFLIVFVILFLLFYYVLIGLIMPNPPELLFLLSLVNALLFTILLVRPRWVVLAVSRGARILARVLRSGAKPDGTAKPQTRRRP